MRGWRIEELLGGFGIEAADEFRRVFKVGKEHRDLLALALKHTLGGQDLLGEIRRGVGEGGTRLVDGRGRSRPLGRTSVTGPDQATAVVLDHGWVGVQEFVLERFQAVVVQTELELERAIGDAAATLEHGQDLV